MVTGDGRLRDTSVLTIPRSLPHPHLVSDKGIPSVRGTLTPSRRSVGSGPLARPRLGCVSGPLAGTGVSPGFSPPDSLCPGSSTGADPVTLTSQSDHKLSTKSDVSPMTHLPSVLAPSPRRGSSEDWSGPRATVLPDPSSGVPTCVGLSCVGLDKFSD